MVGLNNLVRQFGLRFHCNGIKQLARDFLKACPAYQDILLFHHFPSTTPYPLLRPIWTDTGWYCWHSTWQVAVTVSGHCLWPTTGANIPFVLYSARCMLGVNSAQFAAYMKVGKLSYSIFSLLLYSARCMLGVNSVQFALHQGRKVELQHFLSCPLFGTLYVRGRERKVFLTPG